MEIVLASNNRGKLEELRALLNGTAIDCIPQSDRGVPEVAETGLSFVENAIIKARHASHFTGLPAIADDSGIEVDELNGAPGIRSARYAGDSASDADNTAKLLLGLSTTETDNRQARFRCEVVFVRHELDASPVICSGTWVGRIAETPRGENGFGYDPVFLVGNGQKSAAELSAEEKNRISHRGQALAQLVVRLKELGIGSSLDALQSGRKKI
jgi:XTP/dITP diphosphohydrolase